MTTDYTQARLNMVDCQIHPMGVVNEAILNAYQTLPREKFVPANKEAFAYTDEDLELDHGCFLMEPSVHSRLIDALEIASDHVVLDIAGANGYSAAILSDLAQTIVAVDSCKESCEAAQSNWDSVGKLNIAGYHVAHNADGDQKHAPFDRILINGSVADVPESLLMQLKNGGKLACILQPQPDKQGCATFFLRHGDNFSKRPLFDSAVPYACGFEPQTEFSF